MSILETPKQSPPAKKPDGQWRKPLVIPLVILGVVIFLAVAAWIIGGKLPDPLTPEDCQRAGDGKLTGEVAIVIDASDAVANKFRKRLWPGLENLPGHTRVRFYSPDARSAVPVGGEGRGLFCSVPPWRWYYVLSRNEGPWKEAIDSFNSGIEETTDLLLEADPSDVSPILEALSVFAADAFGGQVSEDFTRELWIVSDMLQHSEDCSFYGVTDCVDGDSLVEHLDFPAKWKSELSGVAVKVLLVPRTTEEMANVHERMKDPRAREAFWTTVFENGCGAKSVQWLNLADI